jgi:SAM-dependent methyltransferase
VEPDWRAHYGLTFGAAAAAYAEHRPGYAEAAARWALAAAGPAAQALGAAGPSPQAPAGAGPAAQVLDLGAGTGKLTAAPAALGADVTAVEPDPAMLAELRRALPAVRALPGRAEAIPLPDASVDAVLVGQAMHWFDMSLAGPEIARVLVPGGILAGLWNVDDDREDWVAGLARASDGGAVTLSGWNTATRELMAAEPGPLWPFTPPERADFPHGHRHTADSLTATIATHSRLLARPGPAGPGSSPKSAATSAPGRKPRPVSSPCP